MAAQPGKANANYKHGMSRSREYRAWADMLHRCTNPNSQRWSRYGARGITVTKRWQKFERFYEDMGPRPKGATLERRNNGRGYSKANCVWATREDQYRNRGSNHWLTDGNEVLRKVDCARRYGISYNTFNYRYMRGLYPCLSST